MDGHRRALGHNQPRQPRPDACATLIETYLELPDWPPRFAKWRARRRLETLTACARRAADAGHGVTPERFAELKRTYVLGTLPPDIWKKVQANRFVRVTGYLAEGLLVRVEAG